MIPTKESEEEKDMRESMEDITGRWTCGIHSIIIKHAESTIT